MTSTLLIPMPSHNTRTEKNLTMENNNLYTLLDKPYTFCYI